MPTDLFTISYLGNFAGLVAVTYLLVQFFKEPIKKTLSDWWVRLLAVFFALSIQVFTLYVTGNFTAEAIGLAVLNSFLIAITAAGMHDLNQSSTTSITTTPEIFTTPIMEATITMPLSASTITPAASKTLPESEDEPPDTMANPALSVKTNPISNS